MTFQSITLFCQTGRLQTACRLHRASCPNLSTLQDHRPRKPQTRTKPEKRHTIRRKARFRVAKPETMQRKPKTPHGLTSQAYGPATACQLCQIRPHGFSSLEPCSKPLNVQSQFSILFILCQSLFHRPILFTLCHTSNSAKALYGIEVNKIYTYQS